MLPNLALATATVGLLLIMWMIYREVGSEMAPADRTAFAGGAVVILAVSAWHLIATAGSAGH
jgi:hypothetical protein